MSETGEGTHAVVRDVGDEDKALFVRKRELLLRRDEVVFTGSEKECRLYVVRHQGKSKTVSLKRVYPYEPR